MSGVLLPEDIELIPSLFAHNQHVYDPVFFRDIVQDTKIAEAKFPRRQRIEPQVFNAPGFLRGLMAEVKRDAVEDDPLAVSTEPT
jgi:hypothetical protein